MHNGWYRKGKEQSTNEKKYAHIFWELFSRNSCVWTMLKKWQAWNSVIFTHLLWWCFTSFFFVDADFYCCYWCTESEMLMVCFSSFGHYSVYNCLTFRLFVGNTCLKNRYERNVWLAKGLLRASKLLSFLFLILLPLSTVFFVIEEWQNNTRRKQ